MNRFEILTEALAQAWTNNEPDGLLWREFMIELDHTYPQGR